MRACLPQAGRMHSMHPPLDTISAPCLQDIAAATLIKIAATTLINGFCSRSSSNMGMDHGGACLGLEMDSPGGYSGGRSWS